MRPIEFNTLNGHSQGVIDRLNKALVGFTADDVLIAMNKGMDDEELTSLAEVLEEIKNEAVINGEDSVKKHFDNNKVIEVDREDLKIGKIYRDAPTESIFTLLKLIYRDETKIVFKPVNDSWMYFKEEDGTIGFHITGHPFYYCESDQNITE